MGYWVVDGLPWQRCVSEFPIVAIEIGVRAFLRIEGNLSENPLISSGKQFLGLHAQCAALIT